MVNKICTRCGANKNLNKFNMDRRNADSRNKVCRECIANARAGRDTDWQAAGKNAVYRGTSEEVNHYPDSLMTLQQRFIYR